MNRRHNLEGWLRDVRSCLNADRYDTLGAGMLDMLRDVLEEVTDDGGTTDESDADDLEPEDDHDDVGMLGPGECINPRKERLRAARSGRVPVGGAAGMANPMARNVPQEGRSRRSGAAPLAGAGCDVNIKRRTLQVDGVPVLETPKGRRKATRGSSSSRGRKAVKRAKAK